jgi:U3 small nucleolar RNA-associated protein 5
MDHTQVISSRFDPFGQFYASAIPSLDLNKVQVHSTSNEGKLEGEITLDKGITVTSLSWAIFNSSSSKQQQRKKRKRSSVAGQGKILEDLVVAIGTNKGSILLFSPSQGAIVHKITDIHSVPVTSLEAAGSILWSCDYSSVVSSYDLSLHKEKVKFDSPEKDVRLIKPIENQTQGDLLLGSTNIQLIDSASPKKSVKSFPGFVHPVAKILQSTAKSDLFLAASQSERNVNINSTEKGNSIKILTAQSDIQEMCLSEDESALAVVTDDGMVEIFLNPLEVVSSPSKSRKGSQAVKSNIQISISRPKSSQTVRVDNVRFAKDYVILTWLENASVPVFEHVNWKDSNTEKPLSGLIELTRAHRTVAKGQADNKVNGVDPAAAAPYNEATSVVSSGKDVKNLESDDEEEEGTLAERLDALEVDAGQKPTTNNKPKSNNKGNNANTPSKVEFSTPGTFTTILTQALKTNDHALLESCLVNRAENVIKLSIQRLDSNLAVKLLERLAEKIARNPSQSGQLNIWIKWVMIAHGGYLVTLPNLLKTLSSLHSTLSDRVSTLPRLLALQGRLELLNSQMELRRDILESSNKTTTNDDEDNEEDEEAVEYIEDGAYIANGEEDMDSDDDDEDLELDEDSDNEGFIDIEASEDDEAEDGDEANSDMEVGEPMSADDLDDDDEDEEDQEPQVKPKKKTNGSIKSKK